MYGLALLVCVLFVLASRMIRGNHEDPFGPTSGRPHASRTSGFRKVSMTPSHVYQVEQPDPERPEQPPPAPPGPEEPVPQPPQPELPSTGPTEPYLPEPEPDPPSSPVPGPGEPGIPYPPITT
jgi:hypothetical protein